MKTEIEEYKKKGFVGRNHRLLAEWESILERFKSEENVSITVRERNGEGLPIKYEVLYKIRSFCGVKEANVKGLEEPVFDNEFKMQIHIGNNYPSIDGSSLDFRFLIKDVFDNPIPHPYHPNIQYYGHSAGKVCIRNLAYGTYTDIAVYIDKIVQYLSFEQYHAQNIPPYPIDPKVADWVVSQAEPNGWINELRNIKSN